MVFFHSGPKFDFYAVTSSPIRNVKYVHYSNYAVKMRAAQNLNLITNVKWLSILETARIIQRTKDGPPDKDADKVPEKCKIH